MSESGLSNDDDIKVDLVQDGRWTREEHFCFLKAVAIYGREVRANKTIQHPFHRCVSTTPNMNYFHILISLQRDPQQRTAIVFRLFTLSGSLSKPLSKQEHRPKSEATHKSTSRNVRNKSNHIQPLAYQRMLSLF